MAEESDITSKQRKKILSFELKSFIPSWKYYLKTFKPNPSSPTQSSQCKLNLKSWRQVRIFTHLIKSFLYKVWWLSSLLSQSKWWYKKRFFASITILSICISPSFAQELFLPNTTTELKLPLSHEPSWGVLFSSEGRSRHSFQDYLLPGPLQGTPIRITHLLQSCYDNQN